MNKIFLFISFFFLLSCFIIGCSTEDPQIKRMSRADSIASGLILNIYANGDWDSTMVYNFNDQESITEAGIDSDYVSEDGYVWGE